MTTHITNDLVSWRNWTIEGGYAICSFCDKKCYTSIGLPNHPKRVAICKQCLPKLKRSIDEIIKLECLDI